MKKVILRIDGKAYEKAEPTVKDWFNYQEYVQAIHRKNVVLDKDAAIATVQVVAEYVGLTAEDLLKSDLDLSEMLAAYQDIQANILECFSSTSKQGGASARKN